MSWSNDNTPAGPAGTTPSLRAQVHALARAFMESRMGAAIGSRVVQVLGTAALAFIASWWHAGSIKDEVKIDAAADAHQRVAGARKEIVHQTNVTVDAYELLRRDLADLTKQVLILQANQTGFTVTGIPETRAQARTPARKLQRREVNVAALQSLQKIQEKIAQAPATLPKLLETVPAPALNKPTPTVIPISSPPPGGGGA